MSGARKCNRCGMLFERKLGDIEIVEVRESSTPPKGHKPGDWLRAIIDEDEPYDLCSACSTDFRIFLRPIRRDPPKRVARHSQGNAR